MDLVYTTYRHQNTLKKSPDWLQEGNSLCSVSSRNTVLFTTSTPLSGTQCCCILNFEPNGWLIFSRL